MDRMIDAPANGTLHNRNGRVTPEPDHGETIG
jgi:hypothetical protein